MRITVVGAGSWGTALACHACRSGHETTIWSFEPEVAEGINREHRNPLFMKDHALPETLKGEADFGTALAGAELCISVVPTQFLRKVVSANSGYFHSELPIISASKGIENETLSTPTMIIGESLPDHDAAKVGVITGPSFASEVLEGHPTTVVLALADDSLAASIQEELSGTAMRVYRSDDIIGAEYCGALKNVIAIASGVISGLGFGDNTRAALITRGLSEITRLITALGGRRSTVAGIAGVGDMVLTCTSSNSRNFTVGYRIGKGETLTEIIESMQMVAEGVKTTRSTVQLAAKLNLELPITAAMHSVLYEGLDPRAAVQQLMTRSLKHEWEPEGYDS